MAVEIFRPCSLWPELIQSIHEINLGLIAPVSEYSLNRTPGSNPSPHFLRSPEIVLAISGIAIAQNSSLKIKPPLRLTQVEA
jgi:hypothetical protein